MPFWCRRGVYRVNLDHLDIGGSARPSSLKGNSAESSRTLNLDLNFEFVLRKSKVRHILAPYLHAKSVLTVDIEYGGVVSLCTT